MTSFPKFLWMSQFRGFLFNVLTAPVSFKMVKGKKIYIRGLTDKGTKISKPHRIIILSCNLMFL